MKNIEDIKNIAKKCLNCKKPKCVENCPIHNPIPEILTLINKDMFQEASQLLFANSNGSIICSKLCDYEKQCYGNCVLYQKNEGIRFFEVEEYLTSNYQKSFNSNIVKNKASVAIIGAGISGISCAIDLTIQGYDVTIYEKENQIGGVITYSLPNFRFNDTIIDKYQDILFKLGVNIEYNKEWGVNLKIEDLSGFKYIIMALGTYKPKKVLREHPMIKDALSILKAYKKEESIINNKNVLVIGGGNVAMDVARVLKKFNNDVTIVYRRNFKNAPASQKEIINAINEGVKFEECYAPIDIDVDKNYLLTGLIVEKMNLVAELNVKRLTFQKTGKFSKIKADYIVEAVGLDPDYEYTKKVFPELFNEKGWIDEKMLIIKNKQVILATGDYFFGASSFVNALSIAKETVKKVNEYE